MRREGSGEIDFAVGFSAIIPDRSPRARCQPPLRLAEKALPTEPRLDGCRRRQHLEGRAGQVVLVKGTVEEGVATLIRAQPGPTGIDLDVIELETGTARQREDRPVGRVKDDDCSLTALELLVGLALEVKIDRRHQIAPDRRQRGLPHRRQPTRPPRQRGQRIRSRQDDLLQSGLPTNERPIAHQVSRRRS